MTTQTEVESESSSTGGSGSGGFNELMAYHSESLVVDAPNRRGSSSHSGGVHRQSRIGVARSTPRSPIASPLLDRRNAVVFSTSSELLCLRLLPTFGQSLAGERFRKSSDGPIAFAGEGKFFGFWFLFLLFSLIVDFHRTPGELHLFSSLRTSHVV
ncbi:hypothetical protein L484_023226 [Morus notabilis]|uniref:Uncharacterized protein n=1 Tax=Morus notabilis TaxID=981085 RepID=W9SN46_9ROSA|nr:hypothetical protein L484_023226 [Morus notabilis]